MVSRRNKVNVLKFKPWLLRRNIADPDQTASEEAV